MLAGDSDFKRLAVPMIGGMASSTVLTRIVVPAVYALVKGFGLEHESKAAVAAIAEQTPPDLSFRGGIRISAI